ncbi:unnamed protein product [Camellia sinensis]
MATMVVEVEAAVVGNDGGGGGGGGGEGKDVSGDGGEDVDGGGSNGKNERRCQYWRRRWSAAWLTPAKLLWKDQVADRRGDTKQCVNWIGWCDKSRRRSLNHDSGSTDVMQLRADVVHIINTLRVMKTNKGVGPSGTEGIVDELDHAHKANWDSAATKIFLQCVRDAILASWRVGTTITKTGYNEIALKFTKRTGRRHEITQLKNKYRSLKKEWQAWNKLMDSSKGVTSIGFDRETGLFTASEEWWENLKSTNKIAYKFKTKPLKHEELMREVFTSATATGKHHWTPGEKVVDVGDGESYSVDSPGLVPFTEPYRPVVNSPPNSPTVHLEEADPETKRKKEGSTSRKSKKISSGASMLADSFNHLSKAVQAQKHLTIRHGTGASQKYGIEPCMQRLMAIPDFISTPCSISSALRWRTRIIRKY